MTDIWSESVVIQCTAYGLPMPDIIWLTSDGEQIDDSDAVNITRGTSNNNEIIETTSSLMITNPTNSDAGAYRCLADNGVSIATNRTIVLVVFGMLCHCYCYMVGFLNLSKITYCTDLMFKLETLIPPIIFTF